MKRVVLTGMVFSLLILIGFGSCDFILGPDEPVNGEGSLVISLGGGAAASGGAGKSITSGAALPGSVLAALRYEVTLNGPGGEVLERTVTGGETLNLTVPLGEWRITAKAYKEDGLAGTGNFSLTVVPGHNPVEVPMYINGGYFDITADASVSNGTVTADFDAAFPETTITLTVTPAAGYTLKAGSVTYNDGSDHGIAGPPYAFTMPAADVTIRAEFEAYSINGTITTDDPGGPVSGASVQLKQDGVNIGGAVSTDAGGAYTIPGVPAGTGYTIEVSLTGYTSGTISSFNITGDVTGKNLTLVKDRTGEISSYTGDGVTFKTAYVRGGLTFPTGTSDYVGATVTDAYEIGETVVTYELWYTVRTWAESNGYTFYSNPGREGSNGTTGAAPTGASQEPVTDVTWYDTAVWLNALTEWVNVKMGKSLTPVYYYESGCTTVATDSDPASNFIKENASDTYASAYAKPGATGFRLPSGNEWELAARWRGSDTTNTASRYTDPYFTKGNSASGATANYNDTAASGAVAWYDGNTTKTEAVKGKAANALGLYDMSGNVSERCFNWGSAAPHARGGSWSDGALALQVGNIGGDNPVLRYESLGFRPARTVQ